MKVILDENLPKPLKGILPKPHGNDRPRGRTCRHSQWCSPRPPRRSLRRIHHGRQEPPLPTEPRRTHARHSGASHEPASAASSALSSHPSSSRCHHARTICSTHVLMTERCFPSIPICPWNRLAGDPQNHRRCMICRLARGLPMLASGRTPRQGVSG